MLIFPILLQIMNLLSELIFSDTLETNDGLRVSLVDAMKIILILENVIDLQVYFFLHRLMLVECHFGVKFQ